MTTQNLLVELFVEELPPKALQKLGDAFATVLGDQLKTQGLASAASVVTPFASPRRLAAHVTAVADKAADKAVQQKLMPVTVGLDASGIAIMLVGAGVAAITGMQVGGRLADRLGARRVVLTCVPLLMVGLVVGGFAANYVVLFVGALLLGLGNGGIDVAMNAIGVQVEAARPKPIMSFFHGMWSVGNFAGAALVYIAALSVPSFAVQAAVLVAMPFWFVSCWRILRQRRAWLDPVQRVRIVSIVAG